jgi:hypothetical protein
MGRYSRITGLYSLGRSRYLQAQEAKCGDLLNTQDSPRGH